MKLSGLFILLFFPLYAIAQRADGGIAFTERTPAYFTDRYGAAKSSKNVSKYIFFRPGLGNVDIKGQFQVREFKSDDLSIEAFFHLPSLKLAAVKLTLPRQWTSEQIEAGLAAYGSSWRQGKENNSIIKVWTTPSELRACYVLTMLEIQSPLIVENIERTLREADAKRKAIPKF